MPYLQIFLSEEEELTAKVSAYCEPKYGQARLMNKKPAAAERETDDGTQGRLFGRRETFLEAILGAATCWVDGWKTPSALSPGPMSHQTCSAKGTLTLNIQEK